MSTKAPAAKTSTFTTRIDSNLKARLEQIAQFEDRSASYIANQAIASLIEEREATYGLIDTALALVDQGEVLSETAVDDWLAAPTDAQFPKVIPRT